MYSKIVRFSERKERVTFSERKLEVYLAGPDVFDADAVKVGEKMKGIVSDAGHTPHFPMDNQIPDFKRDKETAYKIARGNEKLMERAQVILANMMPWHGPSMDVGTAFEIGFMRGKHQYCPQEILIIGYYPEKTRVNMRTFVGRVVDDFYKGNVIRYSDGTVVGKDGKHLENFGLEMEDNLMLPHAIRATGGEIFGSFEEAVKNIQTLWDRKTKEKPRLLCGGTKGAPFSQRAFRSKL